MSLSPQLFGAAVSLGADMAAAELARALREHNVRWLLLKGPSVATRLYGDGMPRPYSDVDVLVAPWDHPAAEHVLREHDYLERAQLPRLRVEHAAAWQRGHGHMVDLHRRIPHIPADPADVWNILTGSTETLVVGGETVEVPSLGATALIVALHALHHGRSAEKPMEDLERAILQLSIEAWREAAGIAGELGATRNLAAALSLAPWSAALRRSLGLPRPSRWEVYLRSGERARLAAAFKVLEETHGVKQKGAVLWRELVPDKEVRATELRRHYGPNSAASIHARRLLQIAGGLPRAFLARVVERRDRRDHERRPR